MYRYPVNFIKLFEKSFRRHYDLPCLTLFGDPKTFSFLDIARNIAHTHILLEQLEIKPGQRIALCGHNSPKWVECFMAIITCGCVVVPILPEFSPRDIVNIVNHSESEILIVERSIWAKMDASKVKVKAVFSLEGTTSGSLIQADRPDFVREAIASTALAFEDRYPFGFSPDDISYPEVSNDEVLVINYTSGTTGFSKGVMLTGWNLAGNVVFGLKARFHRRGGRLVSLLPLAHAYGCAFDMLTPLAAGTHVTILGRTPTPTILLRALAEVRPDLILSVPLVFEKIYKTRLLPKLRTPRMKRLLATPVVNLVIYSQIRRKLLNALGGEISLVVIGGASFDPQTEEFLRKIRFPFTVGFGMTECGPLISYTPWQEFKSGSAGRTLPNIMETRVDSPDPQNVPGEIFVRGQNVMKGYFRNEEATRAVLSDDGWLNTGDIGTRDPDGTLYLRGRSKTMILSSSGQNIYPEEIEALLGAMPLVKECLVVDRKGKITALIYPDYDEAEKRCIDASGLKDIMEKIRVKINREIPAYEQISAVEIMEQEFEKTPKRSIKRFLYT